MSKLIEMNKVFPQTELWTDSFSIQDHVYGLQQGCRGITTSPTWVSKMMCDEPLKNHEAIIKHLHNIHPDFNEYELTWSWTLEMGKQRSKIMLPLWQTGNAGAGRFSIQTSIYEYNNYERMLNMAREVHACGPNMQIKIPCTQAGIQAIEEATYEGISCMATQCFAVDQAIAAAEAMEHAMNRREQEGLSNSTLNPMCAILVGMTDECLKDYALKNKITIHPDALNWGGVAIVKKINALFQQRKYHTRLLIAYYRNQLHWSEFIGGDIALTIPVKWQKCFEKSDVDLKDYMHISVDDWKLKQLQKMPMFLKLYNEASIKETEFCELYPVVRTFRYFTTEYQKAVLKIRDMILNDHIPVLD